MSYTEFTLESVKDFILKNGGRVTNHELVTHFKSHLNDQNLKGINREKFKDFVNKLATIKIQEKGEKVLVLKKKFRPEYETGAPQYDPTRAMSEPPDQKQTSGNRDNIDGGNISKVRSEGNISTSSLDPSVRDSTGASTLSMSSVASSTSLECQIEDDPNASVVSVKDKVQHLNKMTSQTDLQQVVPSMQKRKDPRFSHNKDGDIDDDSHSSGSGYVTLEAEEKEWLVTCSAADYHPMAKILSKNSSLARLRDFTNTALHWAAKHGKPEVIKLLAGCLRKQEFNQRTGYTPLHLAAMQGHEDIIQLLVQTYKVDSNIRDYSGKKAKQYLKNSASSKAQQLLLSRRLGSTSSSSRSLDDSFTRSASFRKSNRARAISSLIQTTSSGMRKAMLRTSWAGSSDDVNNDRLTPRSTPSPSVTPPGSVGTSPATVRRGQTFAGSDRELMPPPSAPIRRSKKIGTSQSKDSLVDDDAHSSKKMEQRCVSEPNLLPTQPSKMTYI